MDKFKVVKGGLDGIPDDLVKLFRENQPFDFSGLPTPEQNPEMEEKELSPEAQRELDALSEDPDSDTFVFKPPLFLVDPEA